MSSKKFILLSLAFFITVFAQAQKVTVSKEKTSLKGESIEGSATRLDGTLEQVSSSLIKYLKTLGKIKQTPDAILINEPTINGKGYALPIMAVVKPADKKTLVWMGVNTKDWKQEDAAKVNKDLEKVVHEFGVKFYKDKIQVQIDESLLATQAVEKQQKRLVNENKNLNTKLEDNKREKAQLEKSIANNKLQHETLLQKLAQNKRAQDSVALAATQIKKVTELHKEKQRKVN